MIVAQALACRVPTRRDARLPPSKQRGVTLIELLVAITLFSLLSVGVLFSLRTGLSSLDRVRDRVASSRRQIGGQRSLELMFAGMTQTYAQFIQPGNTTAQSTLFFQGDPQTMRFVSNYSLQEGPRTAPRLVELTVIPADQGAVRLVMNERPYPGPLTAGTTIIGSFTNPAGGAILRFHPVSIGPGTFVVADRLPGCRFFYLEQFGVQPGIWRDQWPHRMLPKAIRVEMGPTRTVTASVYVSPSEI